MSGVFEILCAVLVSLLQAGCEVFGAGTGLPKCCLDYRVLVMVHELFFPEHWRLTGDLIEG